MDTDEDSTREIDSLRRDADAAPARVDLDAAGRFLDSNQPENRQTATYVFKQVAKSDARRVSGYLDSLEPRLDDSNGKTRNFTLFAFSEVVEVAPQRVNDYLDAIEPRLGDESENTRNLATYVFKEVAQEDPRQVIDSLGAVEPRLDDSEQSTRNFAVSLFSEVVEVDPRRVSDYLDAIEPRLGDESESTRNLATYVFGEVAREEPRQVIDYLDAIEPRLDDESENTRNLAAYVFGEVSKEEPRQTIGYLDALVPRLDDPKRATRNFATTPFREGVEVAPQRVSGHIDALEPRLDDESENTRNLATYVFTEVAKEEPRQVIDYLDAIESRLDDPKRSTREFAASTFATVSEEYPSQVVDYLPSIVPLLADGNDTIEDCAGSCFAQVARHDPEPLRDLIRSSESKQFGEAAVERVAAILAANTSQDDEDDIAESTQDGEDDIAESSHVDEHVDKRRPADIPGAPEAEIALDEIEEERTIGQGGNADVVEASVPGTVDTSIAIKRPRMSGTVHGETIERMLDEAERWERLDGHDHIVGVVDWGASPVPWIGMEFMDGGHLGERAGEMSLAQKLWTALVVTKGVRHAHKHGVAHLDLKPENVLFRTVEDAWDVPKVADWGLSKQLLEHSQSVQGLTPQYAAPEQFDDDYGTSDHSTDIYQLGAVFYELFTGQPPFDGNPSKAMYQILESEPTPPSEIAAVPPRVDEILLTALSKSKAQRYDDILYLRDALQEACEDL